MTGYTPKMTRVDRARRREKVARAYASNLSRKEVAARFGISPETVKEIARLYGVSRPVGRPRTNPIFQEV